MADDRELMARARDGDRDAFGALVEATLARAHRVALALTGSREAALDLVQDAYARAFEARARLDPERPFLPFLYAILRRRCFTWLRDERARARKLETVFVPRARDDDPASRAARDDEHRRVVAAIEALPPAEREVLALKDLEGLRYRDIADLVGIPMGTVMSRLYSARRRVAQALEESR